MHTSITATQPADLLANIPGLLGFYPNESLVFISFDPHPVAECEESTTLRLQDLTWIPLNQAHSILPEDYPRVGRTNDLLFALIISQDPVPQLLHHYELCLDLAESAGSEIDTCLYAPEIITGAPVEQVHCEGEGILEVYTTAVGRIPSIMHAAATTALLDQGELPELNHQACLDFFAPTDPQPAIPPEPKASPASSTPVASPDLPTALSRMRKVVGAYGLRRPRDRAQHRGEIAWVAEQIAEVEYRDLAILASAERPAAAEAMWLDIARATSGTARASALCLYAFCRLQQNKWFRVKTAILLASQADPGCQLARLVFQAMRQGSEAHRIAGAMITGAHRLYHEKGLDKGEI